MSTPPIFYFVRYQSETFWSYHLKNCILAKNLQKPNSSEVRQAQQHPSLNRLPFKLSQLQSLTYQLTTATKTIGSIAEQLYRGKPGRLQKSTILKCVVGSTRCWTSRCKRITRCFSHWERSFLNVWKPCFKNKTSNLYLKENRHQLYIFFSQPFNLPLSRKNSFLISGAVIG